MNWINAIANCRSNNTSCVVVMIANVAGSAPRTVGTRMVVTLETVYGTIGGGALELEGISHARALIGCSNAGECVEKLVSLRQFNLGKELSQCCGGVVSLQFDCHFANDFILHVFGAGHVGQEVARLASRLPCAAVIHDSREVWLEYASTIVKNENDQSNSVQTRLLDANIHAYIEALLPAAYYLVMTHSHELDMEIVEAVLSRSDAIFCGLIASESKASKFRNRLKRKGFTEKEIRLLSAPLGQGIRTGNTPMEVAIAGISDVLTARERAKTSKAALNDQVLT